MIVAEFQRFIRIGLTVLVVAGLPVWAAGAGEFELEVGATSRYVVDAYDRSDGGASFRVGAAYRHRSGVIGGVSLQNVAFAQDDALDDPREIEVQPFVGWAGSLGGGFGARLLAVRYEYPGAGAEADTDYAKYSAGLTFGDWVGLTVSHAEQAFNRDLDAQSIGLATRVPLPVGLDLLAAWGHTELDFARPDGPVARRYGAGQIGLARRFGDLELSLAYFDADAPEIPLWGESIGGSWILGATLRFEPGVGMRLAD